MLKRADVEAYITGSRSTSFVETEKGRLGVKRAQRVDLVSQAVMEALSRGVPLSETPRSKYTNEQLDEMIRTDALGIIPVAMSEVKKEKDRVDGAASRQYITVKFRAAEPGAFPDRYFTRNVFQGYEDPVTRMKPIWVTGPADYKAWIDNKVVIKGAIMTGNVEPYATSPRKDREGNEFIPTVDSFTCICFPGEEPRRVFEQTFNHPLALPTHSYLMDQTEKSQTEIGSFGGKV